MDFETRSEQDIDVGPWKYSEHPSTEALCLAYTFGLDEEVHLWHMATEGIEESPRPDELLRRIEDGWLVEAHNAMFERAIWTNVMARRRLWPLIRREQWRCSAAKAAYHCLPRALEQAAETLGLEHQKDPIGKELIRKLSKPRKILKSHWKEYALACRQAEEEFEATPPPPSIWNEDQGLVRRNWEYCRQDVRTERALSLALPDMPERELRVWQMDQEMNARGISCDLEMARAAIDMASEETARLNGRLAEIIPGVEKATQRAKIREWLMHPDRVPGMPDTTAQTVETLLKRKLPGDVCEGPKNRVVKAGEVRQVLDIVRKVNKSSLAKYRAILDSSCEDGCLRDLMMYAGAHTLRWVGKNVQPHNFPRGGIKDMELAASVIKEGDATWARALYGDVMELLSHALRGALISGRGRRLWVADFAAIEARVVFWLAECRAALEVFERGDDIYCDMSSRIYGRRITKEDKDERQMGKQSILGLGFGMGFCKFLITLRRYNIKFTKDQVIAIVGPDECRRLMAWMRKKGKWGGAQYVSRAGLGERDLLELVLTKFIVDLYRQQYSEVPAFWKLQEASAIHCVEERKVVQAGKITWELDGRRLLAHLPSGTAQTYWDPRVGFEPLSDEEYEEELRQFKPFFAEKGSLDELVEFEEYLAKKNKRTKKLEYHGIDQKTRQWSVFGTYGGEITENVVQHFARDLMAEAMLRIEEHPTYRNLLSVHDEELADSREDEGSEAEFRELVSRCPEWAAGCPIDAEVAKIVHRYKKG